MSLSSSEKVVWKNGTSSYVVSALYVLVTDESCIIYGEKLHLEQLTTDTAVEITVDKAWGTTLKLNSVGGMYNALLRAGYRHSHVTKWWNTSMGGTPPAEVWIRC